MKNIHVLKVVTVVALTSAIAMGGLWTVESLQRQKELTSIKSTNKKLSEQNSILKKEITQKSKQVEDLERSKQEIEKTKSSETAKLKEVSENTEIAEPDNISISNPNGDNTINQETNQTGTDYGLDAASQKMQADEKQSEEPEYAIYDTGSVFSFASDHNLTVDELLKLNGRTSSSDFPPGESYRVK